MSQSGTDSGQSMEDILASIRRIIAEGEQDAKDKPGATAAPVPETAVPTPKADVFELTQVVGDDGSIVNLSDATSPALQPKAGADAKDPDVATKQPAAEPAKPEAQPTAPAASAAPAVKLPEQPVAAPVSPPVAAPEVPPAVDAKVESAMAALSRLMDMTKPPAPDALAEEPAERSGASLTVEDLVRDAVRPLLRQWLDANLPPLVERLVREAVDKIAKRAG